MARAVQCSHFASLWPRRSIGAHDRALYTFISHTDKSGIHGGPGGATLDKKPSESGGGAADDAGV